MLIGDSGVGKTCLLVRFKDGAFLSGNFISTVGIDFRVRQVSYFLFFKCPSGLKISIKDHTSCVSSCHLLSVLNSLDKQYIDLWNMVHVVSLI